MTNEWPVDTLDVDSLLAAGWYAKPFQQFIIKLHGQCNLACDYCYMYQFTDQLLWSQSKAMPPALIRQACRRIAEHVTRYGLTRIEVSLHGGEPLLAGSSGLISVVTELRLHIPDGTVVDLVLTTNGILLTEAILDVLLEHNIQVGVSLDGNQETHDKHRRYRDDRGSYAKVVAGLELLTRDRYRTLFTGLLCVIDVEEDPLRTYEALIKFAPPSVDFLLPHGNWTEPPPRRSQSPDEAPYGRWLVTIFDRWFDVPEQETEVRLFAEIINLVLGGQSRTESVGTSPVALITVNTDGSMEQVDTLRSAYPGAPTTGLNILTDSFDDALHHPAVVARQIGMAALADACQQCEIVRICGGGHYAHRYRQGSGFRNPSVYCADLTLLINHIADRLRRAFTEDITSQEARYHNRPADSPSRPPSPGGSHPAGV